MAGLSKLAALTAVALALLVSGCGSDDNDSEGASAGGSTAEATAPAAEEPAGGKFADIVAQVQKLTERPTQIPITDPIEGEVPTGKTIDYLQCGVPACVVLGGYLKEAAAAVKWKVNVIDEGGTPESVKAAWGQAVRNKADAIVTTGGFPQEIFKDELAQVKKAGIPVIGHSEAVEANPETGYISMVSGPERNTKIGTMEADWIIAKTDGKAKVFFVDSGFPINGLQLKGLKAELEAKCPDDCSVKSYQAPITSIGKDLAGKVASQMQANQGVDFLVPAFGDMAIGVPAALAGAGIEQPALLTQEPGKTNLPDIRKGDLVSWNGSGPESMWGAVDALIRHFNKQEVPLEVPLPEWFITKENAPAEDEFPTVVDYQAQFKKLWGVA